METKAYQAMEAAIAASKGLYKETPEMHSVAAIIAMTAVEAYERKLREMRRKPKVELKK